MLHVDISKVPVDEQLLQFGGQASAQLDLQNIKNQ